MKSTKDIDLLDEKDLQDADLDSQFKQQLELLEQQLDKPVNINSYKNSKKASHWLWFKRTAWIFLAIAIAFVIGFVLAKFFNYYSAFGAMNEETKAAAGIGSIDWMQPFNKWNWWLVDEFTNKIEFDAATGNLSQVYVDGLFWAGTQMNVTRAALMTNNFANGMLYIAMPCSLAISLVSLLLHFLIGKHRVKSIMNKHNNIIQQQTAEPYKLLLSTFGSQRGHNITINRNVYNTSDENKKVSEPVIEAVKAEPVIVEPVKTETITKTKTLHVTYPSVGKNEIISEMYNDLQGTYTLKALNEIYDLTFSSIIEELYENKVADVTIFNFGKFSLAHRKGRYGINPATGQDIWINAKDLLTFNPASKLKRLVNHDETDLPMKLNLTENPKPVVDTNPKTNTKSVNSTTNVELETKKG